jgi:ABC-type branched-subunit amino acid transport system substrate-binding protein
LESPKLGEGVINFELQFEREKFLMILRKKFNHFLVTFCLISLSGITSAATSVGVTDTTIVIGQSAAFSGPAAKLGESMREGGLAYFDEVNRQGGVHGRKIELISLDDGYEPDRAIANTQKLIGEHKVFALFGYVGTPTSYAVIPIITNARIPFFGPFTGAEGLRNPVNKYIFNVRASYYDETEQLVDWLVSSQRKTRIAIFYQDDAYGKAGLDGVMRAMNKRKLKLVASGTVTRNTVDVDDAVKTIKNANPDAVIMISAYKSCAAFIKQANVSGHQTWFLNVSFVGSEALASELGTDGHGVIISQVVPYPNDPSFSVAMEFSRLLKRYSPNSKASFNNLEGYIAAKAFVEGLRRAGKDLTREKFIAALESFREVDVGKFHVTFTPENHSGSNLVTLTVITGSSGSFMPFWYGSTARTAGK